MPHHFSGCVAACAASDLTGPATGSDRSGSGNSNASSSGPPLPLQGRFGSGGSYGANHSSGGVWRRYGSGMGPPPANSTGAAYLSGSMGPGIVQLGAEQVCVCAFHV